MKKLSIILAIFTLMFSFMPTHQVLAAPACPLSAGTNETIVNFNGSIVFSSAPPHTTSTTANIPAGKYEVTSVTYDDHTGHGGQGQYAEIVNYLFSLSSNPAQGTGNTVDIPEGANYQTDFMGTYTFGSSVTSITATHGAVGTGNYQSVIPLCLKFKLVEPPAPELIVSCNTTPGSVRTGDSVTWNVNSTGGNGTYTYSWSGANTDGKTQKNFSNSYNTTGTKTATVIVTSGTKTKTANCFVEVTQTPVVALEASCSAYPSNANLGSTVTWTAHAAGGNGSYTYEWEGASLDGKTNRVETRSYSTTGTKTAYVTVRDGAGQSIRVSCNTNVQTPSNNNFDVTCKASDTRIRKGDSVTFTADVNGGNSPFSYNWNGDISGNDRTESVRFNSTGRYDVDVTVRDNSGRTRTDSCPVVVVENNNNDDDLDVTCKVSTTSIREGDRVTFTASVDGGNSPFRYDWSGDISGDDRTETVRFNRDGRYTAKITVRDDDGNRASDTCSVVRVSGNNDTGINVITNTTPFSYNTTTINRPPSGQLSSLSSVYLSQVPYTGAKEVLTVIGYIVAILVWSGVIVFFLRKRRVTATKVSKINAFKEANKKALIIE